MAVKDRARRSNPGSDGSSTSTIAPEVDFARKRSLWCGMTESSAATSDDPLIVARDERWHEAERAWGVGLRRAIAAAVAGHLFLGTAMVGGFDGLLAGLIGMERRAERRIGDERGVIDGVSAEVIDAAEFNKRYIAFKAGNAAADASAAAQQPSPAAEPQRVEPEAPSNEAVALLKPADGWAASTQAVDPEQREKKTERPKTKERPAPDRPAQPSLTEAEARELVEQSIEDLQSALVSVSAPGAARLGEASPYVRGVIRTLKANMPKPAGMKGDVVIQLVVGVTGAVEGVRVVKSSGRPDLDRLVAERVYKTRLAAPPATASLRERAFQITYSYN